jgi:hypothetical protein
MRKPNASYRAWFGLASGSAIIAAVVALSSGTPSSAQAPSAAASEAPATMDGYPAQAHTFSALRDSEPVTDPTTEDFMPKAISAMHQLVGPDDAKGDLARNVGSWSAGVVSSLLPTKNGICFLADVRGIVNASCTSTNAAATYGLNVVVTEGNGYRWTGVLPDGASAPRLVDDNGNIEKSPMNSHSGFTQLLANPPSELVFSTAAGTTMRVPLHIDPKPESSLANAPKPGGS